MFEVERNSLKKHLDEAQKEVLKRKMYVNPMLLEDLKGLLKRALEKYKLL